MASFEGKLLRCGVTEIRFSSLGRSYFKVIVKKDDRQAKAGTVNEILTNARNIYELKIRNYEEQKFPLEIENKTIYETLQEAITMGMNSRISYECMVLLKMSAMTHILSANYAVVQEMKKYNAAALAKISLPQPPSSPAASASPAASSAPASLALAPDPAAGQRTPSSSSSSSAASAMEGIQTYSREASGGGGASSTSLKSTQPDADHVPIETELIVAKQKIIMFSENMPIIITEQDENLKEVNALVDLVFSYLDRITYSNNFNPKSYIDNINTQIEKVKYSLESNVLLGYLKICEFKVA